MTNEQLYILLEWIAACLWNEIEKLEDALIEIDSIERHPSFYENGVKTTWAHHDPRGLPFDEREEAIKEFVAERGLEIRYDGTPIMLDGLFELQREITRKNGRLLK